MNKLLPKVFTISFLCLSLLFWGWLTDVIWLGMLLAALLMSVVGFAKRLHMDEKSCHQIGDLCLLIVLGVFAFYWLDSRASQAFFPTLRLLPLAFFPLLLLQFLHEKQLVPSSALLLTQRKSRRVKWVDIQSLFVVLCMFSAGASSEYHVWYFPLMVFVILTLMLQKHRREGKRQKAWLMVIFSGVAGLSFVGQLLLFDFQQYLASNMNQWLMNQHGTSQTSTAIGRVGRLKLSDEIVFRVEATDVPLPLPLLLQSASYQRYAHEQWFAEPWTNIDVPFHEGQGWVLQSNVDHTSTLTMYQSFEKDKESLPLPSNVVSLQLLPPRRVTIAQGDSVVAHLGQHFAAYNVRFGGEKRSLPQPDDLRIPRGEAEAVTRIANQLNLYKVMENEGEQAVLQRLNQYFMQEYTYSTWLEGGESESSPVSYFLINSHSGHCEYFATATVLLLREVGIASRYAVGFAMQEKKGDYYVVRGRDAHAWALAAVDGVWLNVDHTPPDWFALEDKDRGSLQALKDAWSALKFMIQKWRYAESEDNTALWLVVLLVLFVYLAWRILRRVKVEKKDDILSDKQQDQQINSSWILLENELIDLGFERYVGETLHQWIKRIDKAELLPLVDQYYQMRFATDRQKQ